MFIHLNKGRCLTHTHTHIGGRSGAVGPWSIPPHSHTAPGPWYAPTTVRCGPWYAPTTCRCGPLYAPTTFMCGPWYAPTTFMCGSWYAPTLCRFGPNCVLSHCLISVFPWSFAGCSLGSPPLWWGHTHCPTTLMTLTSHWQAMLVVSSWVWCVYVCVCVCFCVCVFVCVWLANSLKLSAMMSGCKICPLMSRWTTNVCVSVCDTIHLL